MARMAKIRANQAAPPDPTSKKTPENPRSSRAAVPPPRKIPHPDNKKPASQLVERR